MQNSHTPTLPTAQKNNRFATQDLIEWGIFHSPNPFGCSFFIINAKEHYFKKQKFR